jgi:glycosyltransferase involved in cell wall biosynthesis
MKVLIFSLAYLPFVGGAEIAIKEITDRLTDIEFDMITVNLDGKQKEFEQIGNIKIYRVGRGRLAKYLFPFLALEKAKNLNQQNNYKIIWAMMANQAGLAALKFKKVFPQTKYFLTLQEGDSLKRIWSRTWFMRSTYKDIYRRADYIQAISYFLANRAKKYGYQGKIEVIPNGVDLSYFSKDFSDQEKEALRLKLGLLATDKVLITTSRLVYKNGIDVLIKAVKDLSVKALIIGSGKLEIRLKSLAQEIGVRDKILFLGYISQRDLPPYLKISDIFIRPSRSEGLGSAFLEAMASGLPVIGTKVGGIPDFLKDGENGLFCEVNNPSDLANKISLLLSDDNLRQKLVTTGQQLALQDYGWQKISQEMRVIFYQL